MSAADDLRAEVKRLPAFGGRDGMANRLEDIALAFDGELIAEARSRQEAEARLACYRLEYPERVAYLDADERYHDEVTRRMMEPPLEMADERGEV